MCTHQVVDDGGMAYLALLFVQAAATAADGGVNISKYGRHHFTDDCEKEQH